MKSTISYILKLVLVFTFAFMSTYCSDINFESIPTPPNPKCEANSSCKEEPNGPGESVYIFNYNLKLGKVDILFVDDNSGSMSEEQDKMSQRLRNFIDTLDSKNIDYRIAVTTTDISEDQNNKSSDDKAANGHGAFQDGKFLLFGNGQDVLTTDSGSTADKEAWFKNVIKRSETLDCESANFALSSCPSGDERGIYAVNLAVDRAQSNFFRKDAHFAVVILSDEDERSDGGNSYRSLTSYDLPSTLVSKVTSSFGIEKTMSFYSLIVKPGDVSCKATQDAQGNQWVKSSYGVQYAKLSQPDSSLKSLGSVFDGVTGDICASNYTSQLVNIGSTVSSHSKRVQLACAPTEIEVTLDPMPAQQVEYTIDSNHLLQFTSDIPSGTEIDIEMKCTEL